MSVVYLGADHAAFEAKEEVKSYLQEKHPEIRVEDLGTHSSKRTNYPTYATKVAKCLTQDKSARGILICGSGIGVVMVANRYQGIRAALCRSQKEAELSRQHNDANVLCLGARITDQKDIEEIIETWLTTEFEGGRHSERVAMFNELGEKA